MKLAFSTNAFTRHPLKFALQQIAAAGFAAVEVLADKPHWYPARFEARAAAQVRRELERLGLAVSNVNANCTFGYFSDAPPEAFFEPSLVSPVARMRRDRVRMLRNTLRFAQAIGADCISITSGKALPTVPPDKAMTRLREGLKPVLELAEKLGVRVGFECEPGLLIEWATELRGLIDALGSALLGANLDIGHSVVMGEDVPATLRLLKGRIWNCHIEDLVGRKHYHLIPGRGNFDWTGLKKGLEAIGYERYLTVELYSYPDMPVEAARESENYLRGIFGRARFLEDAEIAFDAARVTDADLDVIQFMDAGVGIDRLAFHKHAARGLKRGKSIPLTQDVKHLNDGTISMAQQQIGRTAQALVLGQRRATAMASKHEFLKTQFQGLNELEIQQVQAEPQIDNGPDHRRRFDGLPCGWLLALDQAGK